MAGERDEEAAAAARRRSEQATAELVGGIGDRVKAYASDWILSLNDALEGKYDAQRLVSDATRLTSRLVRDAAYLFVSGYEFVDTVSNLPGRRDQVGGSKGGGDMPETATT
jgi:hypothetical protein